MGMTISMVIKEINIAKIISAYTKCIKIFILYIIILHICTSGQKICMSGITTYTNNMVKL